MQQDARRDYKVRLTFYERKAIASRLADTQNGIFSRHFPDVKAQVEDLARTASKGALPTASLEQALLQVSLALTFRPDAQRARKALFDYFVLALLLAEPGKTHSVQDLASKCTSVVHSKKNIPPEQVAAAVERLTRIGFVTSSEGVVRPTEKALSDITVGTVRLNESTNSFAADVVSAVRQGIGGRLNEEVRKRIARNARAALLETARAHGALYEPTPNWTDNAILEVAKRQLPDDVGDATVAALAQMLRMPTEEQANTLKRWTQAYVAFALMGLDPTLNSFQASRFGKKIFILDTDIVLGAVVAEGPRGPGIRTLIEQLHKLGCRLIIPDSVIDECVRHAERSTKTYNYFGSALLQLTPALVDDRVWNAFVAGYYYGYTSGRLPKGVTYEKYLSNYFEPRNPRPFFISVIKDVLSDCVEIVPLAQIRNGDLDQKEVGQFAERFKADLAASKKAKYRSQAEQDTLAQTDAELFLTALHLNPGGETFIGDVLGGACYLVTEAARYSRVARDIGVTTTITVRPGALAGVQELVGTFDLTPTDFLQLFENPFLDAAVGAIWPDVEKLVRTGVSVAGMSLPRLRFDVDGALHSLLIALSAAEDKADQVEGDSETPDQDFLAVLRAASTRGYSLIPEVETLKTRIEAGDQRAEQLQKKLDELMVSNEELEQKIEFFGRRKRRYLKRLARSQKR